MGPVVLAAGVEAPEDGEAPPVGQVVAVAVPQVPPGQVGIAKKKRVLTFDAMTES